MSRATVAVAALAGLGCALAVAPARAQAPQVALKAVSPVIVSVIAGNGSVAAAVSADHQLRTWDVRAARLLQALDVAGRDVALTAMSDDGRLLLMADYRDAVTVWNPATGHVEFEERLDRYLTAAAFSRDGRLLAVAPGSPVRVYDIAAHRVLYELERTTGCTNIVFSRDNARIATTDGDGVRIYDARTGALVSNNTEFLAVPLAVDFTADGKHVVAGGGDNVVLLIDAATGKTVARMPRTAEAIFQLAVSPDGRRLAVVTQQANAPQAAAPVVFADLPSLRKAGEWTSPAGVLVPGAAWNAEGHFLAATATADVLHLWRVR